MKWVDDQGRLWGKFNILDVAIIVAVVILLPGAWAAYQIMAGRSTTNLQKHLHQMELNVTFHGLKPQEVELLEPGLVELDALGNIRAELLELGPVQEDSYSVKVGKKLTLRQTDVQRLQVWGRLRALQISLAVASPVIPPRRVILKPNPSHKPLPAAVTTVFTSKLLSSR